METDSEIIKMHRFENEHEKKDEIFKSIILYGCEIIILMLPLMLVYLIFVLFNLEGITLKSMLMNKDIIWFSISTLVLFNFKKILSNKTYKQMSLIVISKALDFLILFFILVYTSVYIVVEVSERGLIPMPMNDDVMLLLVVISFVVSSIINISYIILSEGD